MEKAGIEYDDCDRTYLVEGEDVNTTLWRPDAPKINPKTDDLIFMQLDLDYWTEKPPLSLKMGEEQTTIVRMFGVTKGQNSVMAHIYNFRPYFYVKWMSKSHYCTKTVHNFHSLMFAYKFWFRGGLFIYKERYGNNKGKY